MLQEPWRWSYKLPRGAGDNVTKNEFCEWLRACQRKRAAALQRQAALSVEQWQAVQWDQAGCRWGSEGGKGASRASTRAWQLMVSDLLLCEGPVSDSGCLLVRQGKGEIMDLAKGQRQNLMHPNNSATPYIGFWFSLGKFYSWFLSSDFSSGFAFPIWLPQIWGLTKGFGY